MEKQTLLNTDIKNGITYFKLISDLEGDYTKNCGLLGEEIDGNFHFLRSYDIKDIYMDDNKNIIVERVGKEYEPFKINLTETFNSFNLNLDKEAGIVTIQYPDGTEKTLEGFLIKGNEIKFITDGSIEGLGTMAQPLRISDMEKTGMYRPVSEFLDLTQDDIIPEGKEKGYRILTKEYLNSFGYLYSLASLNELNKQLIENKSEWRIPSKKDWDDLLNAMEINDEAKNHNLETNGWHGELAGIALKSNKYWKKYETSNNDTPVEGQNISGLNILPLGIGTNRNEVLNEIDNDIEGFGKIAGFWSNSLDLSNNAFVKIFGYNSAKVGQDTYSNGARMSIRLVKDFDGSNYNEIEYILGELYPTTIVNGVCPKEEYNKIWTSINIYNSKNLDVVASDEWSKVDDKEGLGDIYFFINEWDGEKWVKKLLNDGDSIVIKNNDEKSYHEWRIIENELVDTLAETNETINNVKDDLTQFVISHVNEELKPYATISYVEDLIVGLEEGDVELGGYVKLETLQSSITETKKEAIDYTDNEINKLKDIYADKDVLEALIGLDSGLTIRNIATEEVAKIVASADTSFDTLKEIADWIKNDTTGSAQMAEDINILKTISADTRLNVLEAVNANDRILELEAKVATLENAIKALEEKIKNIENNGTDAPVSSDEVKTIIKDYIVGNNNEIKIESNTDDSKLIIGFADDAIFG